MATNITIIIKNNEDISSAINELLHNINEAFNILLDNFHMNISNMINELFENSAGYILIEYIKLIIKYTSNERLKRHFLFNKNKWYDFKYDGYPVKIITFKENNYYSCTTLSSSQYNYRKDMIYVSLVYSIGENNSLSIIDKLVTTSDNIRIKYDKVIYNSIFNSNNDEPNESGNNESGNNEPGNNEPDDNEYDDNESGNNESGNSESDNDYDPWEVYIH